MISDDIENTCENGNKYCEKRKFDFFLNHFSVTTKRLIQLIIIVYTIQFI